jgi:hypothetical protein
VTWLLSIMAFLFLQTPPQPDVEKYQDWCMQGGQQVVTQGQNSTTRVQRSFPQCRITVFDHGTTNRSTIFSSDTHTPLGNPFDNQDRTTGQYYFYAAHGRYDVQIAATGLTTFTLTDITLGGINTGNVTPPPPAINCGLTTVPPNQIATCIQMTGGLAYPQWWGAKADGVILGGAGGGTGCTGTVGSATISCTGASFAAGDVGKRFDLAHAGTPSCGPTTWGRSDLVMNCGLVGTITAVTNATTLTLSTQVLSAVVNEQFAYASSDDNAVQQAINSTAHTIALSGIYGITGPVSGQTAGNGIVAGVFKNRSIVGYGLGRLLRIGPIAWSGTSGATLYIGDGSENFTMQNVSIWGTNALGELSQFGAGHDSVVIGFGNAAAIRNISFLDCDFSHNWGIGLHAGGGNTAANLGVRGMMIRGGFYNGNSYDGLNPNITDGLVISAVNANYNGTGGLEANSWGSMTVTGSVFDHNKDGGMSIGGVGDPTHGSDCTVTGNTFAENGNGVNNPSQGSTVGHGAIFGEGVWNCSITGNTFRHNHLIGLQLTGNPNDQNFTVTGNTISSNGIRNATTGTIGLYGNFWRALVSGNTITDENIVVIETSQRTSGVVTVKTFFPHNFNVGDGVNVDGTPSGIFNNPTATVTSVPSGNVFTFAQAGADTGIESGGYASGTNPEFLQYYGLAIQHSVYSQFVNNHIYLNWVANVAMQSIFTYNNSLFSSETNTLASNDIRMNGLVPSSTGMMLAIPDIQTTDMACMTTGSANSTCTVTIHDNFGSMNRAARCTFRDTPQPNAGFPIVLKVVPANVNDLTVTIGHIDGGAAGGGTIVCASNFLYTD